MNVYTRTGDDGTTGLIGGTRVRKYDIRLEAYGTVDELNSYIGLVRSAQNDRHADMELEKIQNKLFEIGSILATDEPAQTMTKQMPCNEADVEALEKEMDLMHTVLPKLNNFILPGGCQASAFCHLARTVCRRAERRIVELSEKSKVHPILIKYINRLSDYLFVLSRKVAFDQKAPETQWLHGINE